MNAPLNVCTHANFVMTRWCAFGLSEPSCLMRLTDNHPSHFLIKFIQNGKSTVCPLLSFSAIVSFYRFLTIEISYFLSLILRDSCGFVTTFSLQKLRRKLTRGRPKLIPSLAHARRLTAVFVTCH